MFSYVFMKILESRPRSYDRVMRAASGGRTEAMKRAVADAVPRGSRVLEIGCGTGELASLLAERHCCVLGFDCARAMVRCARERAAAEGIAEAVELRHMGVDGMDELDASAFDAVVATLVFSELSADERRYALRQASRALRPGGLVVIADEVVPRGEAGRLIHAALRAPALALTYIVTGSRTTPIPDLAGELAHAGFLVEREERSGGDAFALVVGRSKGATP